MPSVKKWSHYVWGLRWQDQGVKNSAHNAIEKLALLYFIKTAQASEF